MGWFRTANRCAIMFELLLILIECLAPANALNYTEIKSTLMVDFDDNELITYKTDNSQARLVKSVAASMVTWPQNSTKEETDYVFVAGVHTFTDSNSAPTVMAAYVASYLARGPINDRLGLFWGCKNDEKSAIVNSAHAVQQMRYSPAVVEGSDDSQLTWNMYNSISYFNTAMVSCCAQAETLNNLGRYPLLFKIAPDIKVMVDKLRYILYHFNWRRLGVVSLADTFGENCQSAVIDTAKRIPDFEQLDAVLVSSSILSRDTAKRDEHIENLKKGLQELKAKNQRIICFCGSTGDFQVVYNTARALDMVNEDYSWIAFNIRKQDLVDWRIETESRDENAMVGIMSLNLACNTSSGSYTNMWAFLKDNFIRDVELTGVGQEWTLCYAYDAASVQHMALAETVKRLDQINIDYNRSITHECLGQIYYQANFEKCNLPEPVFVEYTQHCDLRYSAVCTKNCRVCGLLNYMQSLDQYYYPPQLIFISVVHGIDLVDGATGRVRFDSHGQRMGLDMLSALFNLQKLKDGQTEEINIHSDNIDTPDVGLTLNVSYFESTDDQSMFDSRLYRRTAPMDERRCHARQRRADAEYIKANTSLTYVMVASLESTPYKQAAWDSLLYDVPLAESALDYIPITNSTAQDAENILMVVDGMLAAARDAVESSDELSSLPEGSVYDLDTSNLTQQQINALMQELTPYVSLMPVMFYNQTNTPPSDRPDTIYLSASTLTFALTIVFASILSVLLFATTWMLIKFRNLKVIRSASLPFLSIVLLGQLAMCVSTWLLVPADNTIETMSRARATSQSLFFVASTATLLACVLKTYRIKVIFRQTFTVDKDKISNFRLITIWTINMLVVSVLLLLWAIFGNLGADWVYHTDFNGQQYAVMHSNTGSVFAYVMSAYVYALNVTAVYFAVMTRRVPLYFRESLWVGVSVYNMTIWFVLRTVALIGDVSSNLHTVILAFTGCAISVGFLCFIFGPKFYIAFSGKGDSMGGTSDHPEVALQEKERIQKEGQVRAEIPTANKKPNSPQTSATDAPAHESTNSLQLASAPGDTELPADATSIAESRMEVNPKPYTHRNVDGSVDDKGQMIVDAKGKEPLELEHLRTVQSSVRIADKRPGPRQLTKTRVERSIA